MSALKRLSRAALLGAALLLPTIQAAPAGGGEDECVHLTGSSGASPQGPTHTQRKGQSGTNPLAVSICIVDNARGNVGNPLKTNADFVPLTGDDKLGFYCVYGVKASPSGGVGGNVGIYLFELDNGEVLLFGSGYGNIVGANLFDAAYDMERIDQIIRFCMGKDPALTPLRIVAPHGHGDHINPACNRELERLGYSIVEIAFHQGDLAAVNSMAWTPADQALFHVLAPATTCLEELITYPSPLGKIWFFERPGHTAGSIDMVVDIEDDPSNRFVVRGSQASSPCMPIAGQREVINAHGNVELLSVPPQATAVAPFTGSSLGGATLTVTGTNFTAAGAGGHRVLVAGAPASNVVVVNDTTITCSLPAGPPGQLVGVAVINNNGQATVQDSFFYTALPTLTSISPTSGDWRGGTLVQVRGSGFQLAVGTNAVLFGTQSATAVTVLSDTFMTCIAPPGTPGAAVPVTVSNPNGQATLAAGFQYNADLVISAVEPLTSSSLGGKEILITGFGFSAGGATSVKIGDNFATDVTVISDTSASAVTPAGTPGTTTNVVFSNNAGSATFGGFRIHSLPVINTVAPAGGVATGGTPVTIRGSGFQMEEAAANAVRFAGIPATQVNVVSDTALTCVSPPGVAGNRVNITLTNSNGTATLPNAYLYTQPLILGSVLPPSGSSQGGTMVTLSGTGFVNGPAGPATVRFGGLLASGVSVLNDSTLTCLAPAGTPLSVVDISLTNANGSVMLPSAYRYHPSPVVSALTPDHGHAGSFTPVTLTGSGFLDDNAGANLIVVGGVAASAVETLSDTTIACVFPPGTPGALATVILANLNGSTTLANGFRYHTAPTIASISPSSAAAQETPRVTLTGTGFTSDDAGVPTVTFGGLPATAITVLGDATVRCNAPVGPSGQSVDVVLTNARGSAIFPQGYRFHGAPEIFSVSPDRGSAQGGTRVTLSGAGFLSDGAGPNAITFDGLPAGEVSVSNDATLSCITPPGTLGAVVDIVISNANGSTTRTNGFSYSVSPPTPLAVAPSSGSAQLPGTVQISGTGFLNDGAGTNTVDFGGLSAGNVTVIDNTTLTCQVPPGTPGTTVNLVIQNANGTGQLAQGFRYHAVPTLTGLSPGAGSSLGGATVLLSGTGFLDDAPGTALVTFGGIAASGVTALDDRTLSCSAPGGAPGATVDVLVSNANGQTGTIGFTYLPAPTVSALSPQSGPAIGGTTVTLTGSGFLNNAPGTNVVRFGGRQATSLTVLSDTTLACVTPRGFPGFVDVRITNGNGSSVFKRGFHYGTVPPTITLIEPASGSSKGGNLVRIHGTGFQAEGAGQSTVQFAGVPSNNVITLDDVTIVCTAPPGPPGTTVDIVLANNSGTIDALQAYSYHPTPTLISVSPPEGRPLLETKVTLTGSGFLANSPGETVVFFGAARMRDVLVLDDSHLTCTPFGGAPGTVFDVTIRNANGSALLSEAYRVVGEPPGIRGISPPTGPFIGGTTVSIQGSGFTVGPVRVSFGSVFAQNLVVLDDSNLTCVSPPGTLNESVTITLKNGNGVAVHPNGFTYRALRPDLVGMTPNSGPAAGGTPITLQGSFFAASGAGVTRVTFDGISAADILVVNDSTLTCTAPAGTAGKQVSVRIENDNGSDELIRAYRFHALPVLAGLAPALGQSEGGTPVTLTGTGFSVEAAGVNTVHFGGQAATNVIALSDTTLTCETPPGSAGTTVDVRVTNQNGSSTLGSAFRYRVKPTLVAVAPARGPEAGGTPLTLTGTGFVDDEAGVNQVTIGGVPALSVTTVNDTTITCSTPAGAAGTGLDVVVSNANGNSTVAGAFTYFTPPSLTSITPDRGPSAGGTDVTLTGSGFLADGANSTLVLFGGVAAQNVIEQSDTVITCMAPAGTAGQAVGVTIANDNGTAILVAAFTYFQAPVLSSLSPNNGPASGSSVTLTGSGFQAAGAGTHTVTFGLDPASNVVVLDGGTLTCQAPVGTPGAQVSVTVTNANGTSTLSNAFRYRNLPTLAAVAPSSGPAAGGMNLTLSGSGFQVDQAGTPLVTFNGVSAPSVVVLDDLTLTCTAPAGAQNTLVTVVVSNTNGSASLVDGYRYHPLPTLTSIDPVRGSELGGVPVTLTGSGFSANSAGLCTVLFGSDPATGVSVVDDATLTCLAPAGLGSTTVDVSVSNANGAATLAGAYRFNPLPTLASVLPASGSSLGGLSLTITGTNFADPVAGTPQVTVGGVAATNVVVVDGQNVQCTLPAGLAGAIVDIALTNANGQVTLPSAFRYHGLPTLTGVLPARGSSASITSVTLSGAGFSADVAGTNALLFGAEAAVNVVVLSDSSITCDVSPQLSGTVVDIHLTNGNGGAQLLAGFTFDAPAPTLTSIAPANGVSSGGTDVTLTGSGFQDPSAGTHTVTFGGNAATNVVVVNDGSIQCKTPAGSPGQTVDVSLTNANGSAQLPGAFAYMAPTPTVLSVTPASGPADAGNPVTIAGSGFQDNGAGSNTVTFGGQPATSVVVASDISLTCLVPAGAAGANVDIEVSNANGTGQLGAGYRYHALPTITSVSPVNGTSLGGTLITMRGTGFVNDGAGTATVLVNGLVAPNVGIFADDRLTFRTPPGASGATVTVSVSNLNGTASQVDAFRYHARPALAEVIPSTGPAAGGNRVTVKGTSFLADGASLNIVSFGGITATGVSVLNDSTIECNVPAGTPGQAVQVTVANVNGTAFLPDGYRYNLAPALTAATPSTGPVAGATLVSLTGSGFQVNSPGTNSVTFGGLAANAVTVVSDTEITCETPAGAAGAVDVALTNSNGSTTLLGGFTYDNGGGPAPIIAGATPNRGTTLGSTTVTLTGSGFIPSLAVFFGESEATNVVVVDEHTITCQTPGATAARWVDVIVRGQGRKGDLPLGFQYVTPPTLGVITPPVGPPDGGLMVVLEGLGFVENDAGETHVFFGELEAEGLAVIDDRHLACVVPAGPALTDVEVVVTNDNGTARLERGFRWQHALPTDLDRDGRGDLMLGASSRNFEGEPEGSVRIFFGAPLPLRDRDSGQADLTALPEIAGTNFGTTVSSGDLNGDGLPELLIGAPSDGDGVVYVFSGPLNPSPAPLLPIQALTTLRGLRPGERFGSALVVGDVDRNGFQDVVVGTEGYDPAAVYVFLGGEHGLQATPAVTLTHPGLGDGFGASLAVGDLDGKGWAEIVVGMPQALRSRHIRRLGGPAERPGSVLIYCVTPENLGGLEPELWLELQGQEDGEGFGSALALCDLTGDRIDELIVGSPSSPDRSGTVRIFRGGLGLVEIEKPEALGTLVSNDLGDRFGSAMAAGDVDGDGRTDLLVGAPGFGNTGRAYLFRGSAVRHRTANEADVFLQAEEGTQGEFGTQVALVDVDGDGFEDMVITAPTLDGEFTNLGRVYVFAGSALLQHREAAHDDGTISGESKDERLGTSTSGDH